MSASAFTFYRGGAAIMAADLSTTPTSSLRNQLCGDAHLSNFGAFNGPDRRLVFHCHDFDETLPGPLEWDVKRLAVSVSPAKCLHRQAGASDHAGSRARLSRDHRSGRFRARLTPSTVRAVWPASRRVFGEGPP